MVQRELAAAVLAAVTLSPAVAAAQDSCEDRFVPDRPGVNNVHYTVGRGCLHVDTSVDVTRGPGSTSLVFPSLVRFGIVEPLELRIAHGIVDLSFPDDGPNDVAASPLGLELKWMALEATGNQPGIGASLGAFAPTNSDFGEQAEPVMRALFDWPFLSPFVLSLNLVGSVPGAPGPDRRAARADYGMVLSAAIPVPGDWLSLFVDNAGGTLLRDAEWQQTVGGGAAFLVLDNLQLDASFDVRVVGEDHPVRVGTGVAWRL